MDTIAAISTPLGNGGIGIIRISGNKSVEIVKNIFVTSNDSYKPNTIVYGKIIHNGEFIDDALVSYFKSPNSYTGEDVIEINSHGGMIVLKRILDIILSLGAKLAEPGEFTKRAFLNGKMDLSQAESVMDIINSKTNLENKISAKVLNGELGRKIRNIRDDILDVLVDLEANIDYPEYDIEEISREKVLKVISKNIIELEKLSSSYNEGKLVKDGINVAIVGKPNVGKSSLLNRLLNEERAIVTDIAGTTRDTIEESIVYKGLVINLIDTAGIHDTEDIVEKIGVKKSIDALNGADVIFMIIDNSSKLSKEDIDLLEQIKDKNKYLLINKIDINEDIEPQLIEYVDKKDVFMISAKENIGIEEVLDRLLMDFSFDTIKKNDELVISNIRHKEAIDNTIRSLINTKESCENGVPLDMVSIDIQNAIAYLGEILGESVSDDVINGIFKKFCLGK